MFNRNYAVVLFGAVVVQYFAFCGDGGVPQSFNSNVPQDFMFEPGLPYGYPPQNYQMMMPGYVQPDPFYFQHQNFPFCPMCGAKNQSLAGPPNNEEKAADDSAQKQSKSPKKIGQKKRKREQEELFQTKRSKKEKQKAKDGGEDASSNLEIDDHDKKVSNASSPIKERKYPKIVFIEDDNIGENDLFSWGFSYECKGQAQEAIKHYKKAINPAQGKPDARAYFKMAEHLEKGDFGLIKNIPKAKEYYMKAATGGCSEAQFKVGFYQEVGECGFEKSIAQAISWYEKAASNTNKSFQALVNLGILYEAGTGVAKDADKAFMLYKEAAEESCDGEYRLSLCYREGIGIPKDEIKAHELLITASLHGSPHAANDLGLHYEREKNYAKALEYYLFAAERGLPEGHFNLGVCYEEGTLTDKNIDKAKEHYRIANTKEALEALQQLDNF